MPSRAPVWVVLFATASLFFAGSAMAAEGPRINGLTPRPVVDHSAQLSRHMNPGQMLRLTLTLQPVQQDDLEQFLRDVQNPHSSRFHQYLTFEQWKNRYAPSDFNVGKVVGWAQSHGLKVVHQFRNNLAIKVEGTAATIEQAFDVKLNHYTTPSRSFYSNDRDPKFPAELAGVLKNVHGMNSYYHVQPANQAPGPAADDAEAIYTPGPYIQRQNSSAPGKGAAAAGRLRISQPGSPDSASVSPNFYACCGGGFWYEATDLFSSQAYDLNGLSRFSTCCNPNHNAGGTPKETSIAIIGSNSIQFSDTDAFAGQYGMATNITRVIFSGATCCNGEMTLDTEWALAFANSFGSADDTAHVYVYEGASTKLDDSLDAWNEAHSDDNARNASSSFGAPESTYDGAHMISDYTDVINAMAAEGWSIAVAAGDHGATDDCSNLSVDFPAADPNVVAAGGANLGLNNNAGTAQFSSLNPWNGPGCNGQTGTNSNNGGGGGGCASIEPRGFYQEVFGSSLCNSDPDHPKRSLPDVALNSKIGQATYFQGAWTGIGNGTSVVAPELAGFFAQVNSYLLMLGNICGNAPYNQACAPLGLPNYWLWGLGLSGAGTGHKPFYDIKASSPFNAAVDCIGGDGGQGLSSPYCATDGYDQASGWGAFNMLQLTWAIAYDLGHGATPDVNFTGPTVNTWYRTDQKVNFTVVSPVISGTSAAYGVAGYGAQWDKAVDDTANPGTPGGGNTFYDGPPKLGATDFLSLAAAGLGCHNANVRGWDRVGLTTSNETYGPVCFDNEVPYVTDCSPLNDPTWHATDVTVTCKGSDQTNGSGLANPLDANIAVRTSVPAGTETAFAATGSYLVCDVAGNCRYAGPYSPYKIDKKAPSISITSPTNTQYIVKQPVAANYSCADGGSGVASCAGTVASGSNIDTSSVGTKTFTVNSADNVANASTQSVSYDVTYRICLLYDPTKASSGRGEYINLQICDYSGANLSSASIVLHATAVDGDPSKAVSLGNVNPGNNFLFGPPSAPGASYMYVLDTQRLGFGVHTLSFTVTGDPVVHTAPFTLKK